MTGLFLLSLAFDNSVVQSAKNAKHWAQDIWAEKVKFLFEEVSVDNTAIQTIHTSSDETLLRETNI